MRAKGKMLWGMNKDLFISGGSAEVRQIQKPEMIVETLMLLWTDTNEKYDDGIGLDKIAIACQTQYSNKSAANLMTATEMCMFA